jgi:hypothetical protein
MIWKQHKQVNSLLSTSQSGWIYLDLKTMNENEKHDEWQPLGSRNRSVLDIMSSKYTVSHLTLTKQQWQMEPSSTTKKIWFFKQQQALAHDTWGRQTMWFHVSSRWYMVWVLYRLLNRPAWSWHLGTFIRIVPAWYWVKDRLLGRMRQVHTWYWNWWKASIHTSLLGSLRLMLIPLADTSASLYTNPTVAKLTIRCVSCTSSDFTGFWVNSLV